VTGARLLIVGLDGATFDVIDPLIAAGRLPNLASLLATGARAPLNSTTPPMTLPAWSSFLTGCNPGRHGILDFVHRVPGTYRLELAHAGHRLVPTLHEWISSLGGRAASIAVPTTWPPAPIDGVVISGFDSPVATTIDRRFVHPRGLYDEIRRRFGGMAFADFQEIRIGPGWHAEARSSLLREIARKEAICRWLLDSERWDSFMVVFGETDTASHHFWMYHDPASPRFRPGDPDLHSTIADVYARADEALGALLDAARPDVVCIASDHGFGGAGTRALYLNRFLESRGWLAWKPRRSPILGRARSAALSRMPAGAQQRLVRLLRGSVLDSLETASRWGDLDWSRTGAWSDEMNYAATIHLNVRGRDADGILDDRDAAIEALTRDLLAWTEDGAPVVARVSRREELYSGPAVDRSPDLVLTLRHPDGYTDTMLPSRDAAPGLTSRRLDPAELVGGKGSGMNGTHRQHGVLVLSGRGFRNGTIAAEMADPMPTLLAAIGAPIPDHCDGRVLQAAFGAPTPASWRTVDATRAAADAPMSRSDAASLRSRLESLGYL
jgi:predicted AlkP superfamily phosphohydrolase/phosphomutase